MKIVLLDGYTTNPGEFKWTQLEQLGEFDVYDWTDRADVVARAKDAEAVISNKVVLDRDLMEQLPNLKYIGILATGTDCIDLKAAKELGITVTNVPVYANYSVPQLAFALILELCYATERHSQSIKEERVWSNQPYNSYWLKPLVGLEGKKLGVFGMGKIGQQVATIGRAFGMEIIAYDVVCPDLPNVEWVDLNDLFKQSDVISLCCPLIPSTEGIINKNTLALMKPTAFLINTARGKLVVDQDLADALNSGQIAGAGVDVLTTEPPAIDNPMLDAKNAVITPHIGWATVEARKRLISETANNLEMFVKGTPCNVVNK